jgi:hypothetical protein
VSVVGYDVVARIGEMIRRVFGQEEIVPPGVIVWNDRREGALPAGVRWWTTGDTFIAANAGNISWVEVLNPANSNLIVVVTKAKAINTAAVQAYFLRLNGAAGGTPIANNALDGRAPNNQVMSQNRIGNNAAGLSGLKIDGRTSSGVGGDALFDFEPVILRPGDRLAVQSQTVNAALLACLQGYEYTARAEELVT